MADRHLYTWQRSLSMGMVAATIGFVAYFNLPIAGFLNQNLTLLTGLVQQPHSDQNHSTVKALVLERNEAYEKVIARLVAAEKDRRLNRPIPAQFQGKTIREVNLKGQHKAIALTFDDGPWQNTTSQILNILKQHQAKATFFVVGQQVEKYPTLIKQVVAEGHALGNHTWNHEYHHYTPSAAANQLDKTASLIYKLTGAKTSLFRPPAGILNNGLVAYAQQNKYAVIMWSADSKDWHPRQKNAQQIVDAVLKDTKPGGIVLLHDGGGDRSKTIAALPQLITQLKKHGYQFVTVPELLEMGAGE